MTIGVIVAFLAYVGYLFQPIRDLSQIYTTLQAAVAAVTCHQLLDTPAEAADAPGRSAAAGGGLSSSAMCGCATVAASPYSVISTRPSSRGRWWRWWATGAGDVSLANLLARFYEVTEGQVLWTAMMCARCSSARCAGSRIVPQDPFFSATIADNIRYGRPEASDEEVQEAIRPATRRVRADPALQIPYNGAGGVNLSVGQRQLISIARGGPGATAPAHPRRATSSVTPSPGVDSGCAVPVAEGTLIVTAHRLSTIRRADRIRCGGWPDRRDRHARQALARDSVYRELYEKFVAAEA